MDFVFGFTLTQKKNDYVWVIVDRPTKFAYFLPVRLDYHGSVNGIVCE